MASISTCFTITPNYSPKPSQISLNPSRHFNFPLRAHNYNSIFRMKTLTLRSQHMIRATAPRRIVESDKVPAEVRRRTMEAVDKCGRRVTVGDVASKAGIKLTEAQRALQALAADTNGFLEVSDEGGILYVFPKDYRSKLASKSLLIRTEPYLEKVKSGAAYLVRVTFGTALIASILIVYTTIIAILTGSSDEDDSSSKRRKSRDRSFDSLFSIMPSPSDLLWYWDPYYHRRRFQNQEGGMNFIEPVFSFVFGDSDPNEGIEEQRWKMIGQYIGSNDGVVTAEELAPYLDVETVMKKDDDSYMLPVLLHFDGQLQVDKEGNILYQFPSLQRIAASNITWISQFLGSILYQFPSLQRTAASKKRSKKELEKLFRERVGGPRKYFKENKWELSKTSNEERAVIGGLGALNLFGVIVLSAMLKNVKVVGPSPFLSFVNKILPYLQLYAISFFAIPMGRWFLIQKRNAEIEKRNWARELRAQALQLPDAALKQKILSAQDMSERIVIDQHRIVYTTDKDVLEQDYEKQEWDMRFKDA